QRSAALETLNAKPGFLAALGPHTRAAIIAIVGVLWIWFAGIIIAQCTGLTDWSPISGLALLTVVLVLLLAGTGAVVGAVMLGAALCVAITLSADMMQDLRTGYLIGSRPASQQKVELGLVWIGPAVSMMTVLLIVSVTQSKFGIPIGPGTDVPAPQADALRAVIEGVQGGDVPYALYGAGAFIGVALGFGGFAGLGVLVGLSVYLPFYYIATYGIGCIANMFLTATKGKRFVEEWGVPMAAGFIVGEGLLALGINVFILIAQQV
ncbi:MAG: OPT/YSL family transporter, partial [Planctomycetota bacterium]